ncbi:hypothetical protein Lesp02_75170 [Lentzea sp. NBRC 105346]|nr:hypothetical protein Lesp02_75170 [Lentzea sp. NBRC 105346]
MLRTLAGVVAILISACGGADGGTPPRTSDAQTKPDLTRVVVLHATLQLTTTTSLITRYPKYSGLGYGRRVHACPERTVRCRGGVPADQYPVVALIRERVREEVSPAAV